MADTPKVTNKAPYIAAHLWKDFFAKMQTVNKPSDLTLATLQGYGLAKGQEAALQSGLKFLGLLDADGKTSPHFGAIQVTGDDFKQNLSTLVHEAYRDLFEKHPLQHAKYESLTNYFSQKYSTASAKKMAKSFAALCGQAGITSAAFEKMRSLPGPPPPRAERQSSVKRDATVPPNNSAPQVHEETRNGTSDELLREFIKTNPMPTGVQWDAATLKTYFEEYRQTLRMLKNDVGE